MNITELIRNQQAEVAALERSVEIYAGILADYERRLAEARRLLDRSEQKLNETER